MARDERRMGIQAGFKRLNQGLLTGPKTATQGSRRRPRLYQIPFVAIKVSEHDHQPVFFRTPCGSCRTESRRPGSQLWATVRPPSISSAAARAAPADRSGQGTDGEQNLRLFESQRPPRGSAVSRFHTGRINAVVDDGDLPIVHTGAAGHVGDCLRNAEQAIATASIPGAVVTN